MGSSRARSQPRPRAGAGHRGGRAGGVAVDGTGRQGGRRRRGGRRHAPRARKRPDGRHRRHRRGREGRSADALQRRAHRRRHAAHRSTSPSTPSTARRSPRSGRGNALAVIALSRAGHDVQPGPVRLHGEDRRRARRPKGRRPHAVAHREPARRSPRPRGSRCATSPPSSSTATAHDDLIAEVREAGARIRLIPDGDVAGAISTAWPDSGADILFGIGGTPEGVIAAAALKCMGGEMQGRLWPRDDDERKAAHRPGLRPRPGADDRHPRRRRQLLLRRHRHHRRRAAARACTTHRRACRRSRW